MEGRADLFCDRLIVFTRFLFGGGCIILLWNSLGLPYILFFVELRDTILFTTSKSLKHYVFDKIFTLKLYIDYNSGAWFQQLIYSTSPTSLPNSAYQISSPSSQNISRYSVSCLQIYISENAQGQYNRHTKMLLLFRFIG